MVDYSSSFSGTVLCKSACDVDHVANQTIQISVKQDAHVLASMLLDQIGPAEKSFEIQFYFGNLVSPVQLIFESVLSDEQFNSDHVLVINSLLVDDLFSIPGFIHNGQLIADNKILDTGNVLWRSGQLVYNLVLPMLSNFSLFKFK